MRSERSRHHPEGIAGTNRLGRGPSPNDRVAGRRGVRTSLGVPRFLLALWLVVAALGSPAASAAPEWRAAPEVTTDRPLVPPPLGGWWIEEVVLGDTANKVLEYMEYDVEELYPALARDCERAIREGRMTVAESQGIKRFYEGELNGYSYLE